MQKHQVSQQEKQEMVDSAPPPPQQPQQQPQQQQQQQWMIMPPPPLPPPHVMHMSMMLPPPQQQFQSQLQFVPQSEDARSLWVGDLQSWMDETYLKSCFNATMAVHSAKVIRNKQTGQPGYGFVEFTSHVAAERALQSFNGTIMPQSDKLFRLNWASFGLGDRRDSGPDHSIFVGDLATDVNDALLLETFKSRYPSVKTAKVVTDGNTGRSKCYGFVRFGDDNEKNLAMTEMNGTYCSNRPMRISTATPKKIQAGPAKVAFQAPYSTPPSQADNNDPTNTTIFVGGLDQTVGDEDLRKAFSQFGEITYVKIPSGKNCGFVQFTTRASAEEALLKVHGSVIGQATVRLSWGRTPNNKQRLLPTPWAPPHFDPNQWNAGAYYAYNPGYDGYGYMLPPQDPAFAYANYANYQQGYGAYPQQVS